MKHFLRLLACSMIIIMAAIRVDVMQAAHYDDFTHFSTDFKKALKEKSDGSVALKICQDLDNEDIKIIIDDLKDDKDFREAFRKDIFYEMLAFSLDDSRWIPVIQRFYDALIGASININDVLSLYNGRNLAAVLLYKKSDTNDTELKKLLKIGTKDSLVFKKIKGEGYSDKSVLYGEMNFLQLAILKATREKTVSDDVIKAMAEEFSSTVKKLPSWFWVHGKENITKYIAERYKLDVNKKYSIRGLLRGYPEISKFFGIEETEEDSSRKYGDLDDFIDVFTGLAKKYDKNSKENLLILCEDLTDSDMKMFVRELNGDNYYHDSFRKVLQAVFSYASYNEQWVAIAQRFQDALYNNGSENVKKLVINAYSKYEAAIILLRKKENAKALIEILDLDTEPSKDIFSKNAIFEKVGQYNLKDMYDDINILQLAILQATRKNTVDTTVLEKMAYIVKQEKSSFSHKYNMMKATEYLAKTYGLEKDKEYTFWDLLYKYPEISKIFGMDSNKELLYDDIKYFIDDFKKALEGKENIKTVFQIMDGLNDDDIKMLRDELSSNNAWHYKFGEIFNKVLNLVTSNAIWVAIAQKLYDFSSYKTNAEIILSGGDMRVMDDRDNLFIVLLYDKKNKEALLSLLDRSLDINKKYGKLFDLTVTIFDNLKGIYESMNIVQFALLQNKKGTVDPDVIQKIAELFKVGNKSQQQYRMKATKFVADTYGLEENKEYNVKSLLGEDQTMLKLFGFIEFTDDEKQENERKRLEKEELELKKKEEEKRLKEEQDRLKKEQDKERLEKEDEEQKIKATKILYDFGSALSSIR